MHDYYAAVDSSIRSRDFGAVATRFLPTCLLCAQEVLGFQKIFAVGNSVSGGLLTVNSAVASGVGESNVIAVRTRATEQSGKIVDKTGKTIQAFDSSSSTLDFDIKLTSSGKLMVADVQRLNAP